MLPGKNRIGLKTSPKTAASALTQVNLALSPPRTKGVELIGFPEFTGGNFRFTFRRLGFPESNVSGPDPHPIYLFYLCSFFLKFVPNNIIILL